MLLAPLLAPLLALQLAAVQGTAAGPVYSGAAGETAVRVPRLDTATVQVDGRLDEPAWRRAAVLTGFSLYSPVDQRPAPDSTDVLVWYSADAIYFGIRAYEPHGAIRATLANRDNVGTDDNVEIHLDSYDQRNRALVFIVNPLGVQADGTKNEGGGFTPGANVAPGQTDLSADFLWQSRGEVRPWGYEVEIRIPFSSLRYPNRPVERWGIQIQRNVRHSGYQETWTRARRGAASFIAQEGELVGLEGMHHGQVFGFDPELTNTVTGGPCCGILAPGWRYTSHPQLGGNLRWGAGSNFVVDAAVKPDFSQVEADATQIAVDQRFALFYPEKRPFFVEGSDRFNVPNTLVYTRTIVQPAVAAKLTGRVGATDVALLSAQDAGAITPDGRRPLVNVLRLNRAFAGQSTAGFLYSGRSGGGRANQLLESDVHYVFGGLYYAQLQGAVSRTTQRGASVTAPLWEAVVDRTGRAFGFHYALLGIGPGFAADNGFVPRTGIVQPNVSNRLSLYGAPGARVEKLNVFLNTGGVWRYRDFAAGRSLLEDHASANTQLTLRGGWTVGVTPTLSSYAFDPAAYARDFTAGTGSAPAPFTPSPRITTFLTAWRLSTPYFPTFDLSLGITTGHDVDFLETARVRRLDDNVTLDLRPTQQLRINATYQSSAFTRRSDGVRTLSTRIPRIRAEYQVTRSVFVRAVAQYTASARAALRDPRTGTVLLVRTGDTTFVPSVAAASNGLRADWLFSYRPSPGTVFFAGYGNSLTEPDALALRGLRRVGDGFFFKLSYLFQRVVR